MGGGEGCGCRVSLQMSWRVVKERKRKGSREGGRDGGCGCGDGVKLEVGGDGNAA